MKNSVDYSKYHINPKEKVSLKKFETAYTGSEIDKKEGIELLDKTRDQLSELQDKLYAHNEYSILIVFQAMDTAGKDGAIKHIMSGLNPSGVKVTSFKTPSSNELEHDYFWRHYKALPGRGEIGIFNRSHYENVLVTKVHPEYILNEHLPNIDKISDIDQKFWDNRYKQIKRFEKNLFQNGTIIFKFFLHLSYEEQKNRFIERIDDPKKNWKFSPADARERQYWDLYQTAYEEALSKTSTEYAPWFVIPANNKWFSRLAIAEILYSEFSKLNFDYPVVSKETIEELQKVKVELINEK
jgi:PPK2 family polyphosphate:nucleotide phosphotransferase